MRKVFLALLAATLPAISAFAGSTAEEQMAHRIGSELKQSGQLRNYEIGVKYHDGVAFLEGKVTSPEQRAAAVRLAQKVRGVSRVECKLAVAGSSNAGSSNSSSSNSGSDEQLKLASATEAAPMDDSQGEPAQSQPQAQESHAFQQREPASMPSQQQQMMRANSARMTGMRSGRGNMPMPSRQLPSMMPGQQGPQGPPMGVNQASCQSCGPMGGGMGGPGMGGPGMGGGAPMGYSPQGANHGASTDNPNMPGYAWPSYASYPNYAALSYPTQYSPTAWPYIGPFYPYPQVPLAWRKVSLEWDDGWWFLDFSSHNSSH